MTIRNESKIRTIAHLSILFLILIFFLGIFVAHASWYDGDDLGYLDLVTVNGTLFEDLDSREIVFYAEDLRDRDGQVEIKGILESERKDLKPSDLLVQISLNGGKSWQDAKGDSRWSYTFRPKIDSAYDLSIQVVRRDGRIEFFDDSPLGTYSTANSLIPYQLGAFVLHSSVAAVENSLNGEATLALGWLAQFVPDTLKKPGTDELLLTVSDLEIDGTTIINGSVVFEHDFSFSYGGASFSLTELTFTKDGASATGSLTLPTLVIPSAPEISFTNLNFSPTAIKYTLPLVKDSDPVQNFEIISGTYGVSLALSALSVNINTANQIPISLANLDGSIRLGSGYGGITIPNLQLVENHISYGTKAIADAAVAAQTAGSDVAGIGQNLAGNITIPNTDFSISNLGGAINLQDKSVSMSGAFNFPAEFGGGSVSLPADKPLILSTSGISTAGEVVFDLGTPPTFNLSGFPTALSALALNLSDNIPSGSLAGEVTLTNFGDVKLDMEADLDVSGLSRLRVAATEGGTRSVDVGGFATLSLSSVVLSYENSSFEVELDGAITPTNDLLTSINGIGEQLVFTGLSIRPDAIALASDLEGWHDVTGASAGFEGAVVQLKKYGLGVDNNLFWLGLKGQASLGGSSASATAKIFHDGSTAIEGIDLTNIYFALGDFFLKVGKDAIAEGGAIANNTQGYIGGLPQVLIDELPAGALNDAQELVVQLQNFQVDVANRSVSLGSVGYTPATPLNATLGPATLTFAGISFTTSSASIDGSISLAGLGLPVSDLPFTDLYLGADGIAGEVDLIGDAGSRTINIMEGEYGFSLNLNALSVTVDTRKALAHMVSLQTFSGGLVFGSGFNSLEIPDLELLAGNAISWGKNTATDAQGSLGRLTLPGDLFSLGNLGGSLDLEEKSLSIAGTLYLPPSMGSASLTIPPDKPLTLSRAAGLSTSGPLVFDPADLPALPLASIDTTLTALSLDVSHGNISGALAGDLNFSQFGGLQIAITAKIDKKGLQEFKIDSGNLDKSFDLKGFATLGLSKVSIGEKNENFYVEIDGNITPTHDLFKEYGKKIDFTGLRIFKTGIKFAGNLNDWHSAEDATFNVNAAKLSLKEYGLGVYHGALWFGLKGQATYLDNEMSLTAKIFQDGTYEISDFGFKGLYLALGDFSLRTSAEAIAGKISGAGSINAGFLTAYLPEGLKDPLTGELQVEFADLGVDLENKIITSGRVTLPFKRPLTPNFSIFSAVIRSVSFGFDGASVDGDFSIEKLADIDLPKPPSGISFADIELSPDGFKGTASYQATADPVKIPVLTGEYGIELLLSELTVAVDTTATNVLDKICLTDLDGAIKLGSAYKMAAPVTQLRMLADKGITWGAASLTDLSEAAQKEADLQSGLSFAIPGTAFNVDKLNGRLYLNDKRMAVWGKIQLPSDLGGASVGITQANALVLSAAGVSTTGEVDVDLGSLGRDIKVAGFGADITSFSFGVTANTISGSIAGDIKLSMFDNLSIGVLVALGNKGISKLSVTADEINKPLTIGGFATLTLDAIAIGGGFGDEPFFVDLDGNLALENEAIADLPQTFDFDGLKIYKDALQLADAGLGGMRDIPGATIAINNSMSMSLSQYGFGVTDNRFWIALAGGVNIAGQEVTATAKLYHNSPHFELASFGADNLTIAIGDFSLRSSIAFSNEAGFEAEGGLHLGALMDAIPAEGYKNALGELPVTIKNVQFDLSDLSNPKLLSGAIVFAPNAPIPLNTEYFNASVDGFEVGMAGGAPYGKVRGGTISFNAVGVLPALDGVSITDLGLAGGGLQGAVNWSGSKTVHVFEDDNYGVDAVLTRISILFDSTQSEITDMFVLDDLGGSLAFGAGYKTSMAPAIDFLDGAYGFAAGEASKLTLPGTGIDLRNVSGSFDFAAGTVTVGGLIAIPYEETEIAFDVDDLTFSSDGILGAVSLADGETVDLNSSLGFGALLTQASLEFNNSFALSAGSLGMELTLEKFFNLALKAHLTLDNDGVDEWGLGGETGQKFTAEAGFANLELTKLGAGYESADGGLYFSMDTKVTMNKDAVLSALPDDLTLSGIQVYANTVKIDSASASSEVNYTVSLANVDLTLKEIGFGYVDGDGFFLAAAGDLTLASLAKIGTGFEVYENKVVFTKEMSLDIHKPAFDMGGTLVLDDDHFKAGLAVKVAGLFEGMEGLFEVGSEGEGAASFVYWQVQLKVPSRIPLSPLPLTVYSVGGGIAYHMQVTPSKNSVAFVAHKGTLLTLTALVDIGSTDNGESWYGEFSLSVDSNARVMLAGDSWIMEGRSPEVPAHIYGTIELGGSPAIFSLKAGLNFSKVVSDMDVVAANGQVDILFAQNDWHIYFGSKERPLSATVLHYLEGQGYLQIDRRGLAMGVKKEFNLKGSAWIFYGRLYGGAEVDLAAGVYPFYIDAKGKIWIGLEAGVHVAGDDYEIISAYAELGGQFKAPPIYIGLHGKARYSFLWGTISGTWDMTFTYPDNPPPGIADQGIESIPLIAYSLPEEGATEVSRVDSININTTIPIEEPFRYDDGNWYVLMVEKVQGSNSIAATSYVDLTDRQDAWDNALRLYMDMGTEAAPYSVAGGKIGTTKLQYTPQNILYGGGNFVYKARLTLCRWDGPEGHTAYSEEFDMAKVREEIKHEDLVVHFETTREDVSFREGLFEVYPTSSTTPVYADTDIYMVSKAIRDGQNWNSLMQEANVDFQVVDAANQTIAGHVEGSLLTYDAQEGSMRYMNRFIPDAPLKPIRMVENGVTGVKLPAVMLADGSYQNPFTYEEPPVEEESAETAVVGSGATSLGTQRAAKSGSAVATPRGTQRAAKSRSAGATPFGTQIVAVSPLTVATPLGTPTAAKSPIGEVEKDSLPGGIVYTEDAYPVPYHWYWSGEHVIQVVKNGAEQGKVYTSAFTIETPVEGEEAVPYDSTAEVISQSVSDPHFYVNYTVDQEAYRADIAHVRVGMVYDPIIDIFWANMAREPVQYPITVVDRSGNTHVEMHEQRVCGQFDSPNDLATVEGGEVAAMYPANWEDVRNLSKMAQWWIYTLALRGCASQEAELAAVQQQFDAYSEEAFVRHSVADFRSLEFRFTTQAPVNWNEVEFVVNVEPQFNGGLSFGQGGFLSNIAKAASSHVFGPDEYIIRSQTGSLEHRLELVPNDRDSFNGNTFVGWIEYHRSRGISLNNLGWVAMWERALEQNGSSDEGADQEYSLERGEPLYSTGSITTLRTSRPASSDRTDALQDANGNSIR
jgi:hypothetical protein